MVRTILQEGFACCEIKDFSQCFFFFVNNDNLFLQLHMDIGLLHTEYLSMKGAFLVQVQVATDS